MAITLFAMVFNIVSDPPPQYMCTISLLFMYVYTAYTKFNLSNGVNQDCVKSKKLGWPCFFAPVSAVNSTCVYMENSSLYIKAIYGRNSSVN